MANRKRNIQVKFYVTAEEKELMEQKMAQLQTKRIGAYLRKMAIDGYIIQVDTRDIKEMNKLLSAIGRNINHDRVARKYGIDYSLKKVEQEGKTEYLVFFKAKDVDVMTAAFKEYTSETLKKQKRESVRQKLEKVKEELSNHRQLKKEKKREQEPTR